MSNHERDLLICQHPVHYHDSAEAVKRDLTRELASLLHPAMLFLIITSRVSREHDC